MTPQQKKDLKDEMYKFYTEKFGDSQGWPKQALLVPTQALDYLPQLFDWLKHKGLLPDSINRQVFMAIAIKEFRKTQRESQMQEFHVFG
jgi:hypothetical protein